MAKNRLIGDYPVIGIRPIIDGRRGPLNVRGSLEEQTMNMAKTAKALFEEYVQTEKTYKQLSGKLKSQRAWYVKAKQSERMKMNEAILDLEKQVLKLNITLERQAIDIRMLEKKME